MCTYNFDESGKNGNYIGLELEKHVSLKLLDGFRDYD